MIENIFLKYNLPPLEHGGIDNEIAALIANAKVLNHAKYMPVKLSEICSPEIFYRHLSDTCGFHTDQKEYLSYIFNDNTSNQLQNFIDSLPDKKYCQIVLTSKKITCDQQLRLRSNLKLIGNKTEFIIKDLPNPIVGNSVSNTELQNIFFNDGGENATIMLLSCNNIQLRNITISNSHGYGLIIRSQSSHITIEHCVFINNKRAGIMVHDGSSFCRIKQCEITKCRHSSNWAAGIVISALKSTSRYGIEDAFEENYFYPRNLELDFTAIPHHNLVEYCDIHHNQSSGLYIDGGNGNVVFGSNMSNNDKEGLCLDFYAAVNLITGNTFNGNGFRKYQSNHDLEIDNVLQYGRSADNSSPAKLPNISIDNSGLNILSNNTIMNAAGGGIKMVRAGFRNIIYANNILDNNQGHNNIFSFAGILLGSAGSEVENDNSGLDRLASYENMIFANIIYGQHKFGILLDTRSLYNDIFDNFIHKQLDMPAIQLSSPNYFTGNNFQLSSPTKIRYLLSSISRAIHIIFFKKQPYSSRTKYISHYGQRLLKIVGLKK